MQSWREQLRFDAPLRGLRPRSDAVSQQLLKQQAEAAFQHGRIEGERALSEQLVRQRSELLHLQSELFRSIRQLFPDLIQAAEKTLVELALETARKVVAGCPISVETVEFAIRETLARVESTSELTILLNQEDHAMLERANSPALLATAGGQTIRFQVSPEVSRGGCLIHTPFGLIDGRRESKFDLLKATLQA